MLYLLINRNLINRNTFNNSLHNFMFFSNNTNESDSVINQASENVSNVTSDTGFYNNPLFYNSKAKEVLDNEIKTELIDSFNKYIVEKNYTKEQFTSEMAQDLNLSLNLPGTKRLIENFDTNSIVSSMNRMIEKIAIDYQGVKSTGISLVDYILNHPLFNDGLLSIYSLKYFLQPAIVYFAFQNNIGIACGPTVLSEYYGKIYGPGYLGIDALEKVVDKAAPLIQTPTTYLFQGVSGAVVGILFTLLYAFMLTPKLKSSNPNEGERREALISFLSTSIMLIFFFVLLNLLTVFTYYASALVIPQSIETDDIILIMYVVLAGFVTVSILLNFLERTIKRQVLSDDRLEIPFFVAIFYYAGYIAVFSQHFFIIFLVLEIVAYITYAVISSFNKKYKISSSIALRYLFFSAVPGALFVLGIAQMAVWSGVLHPEDFKMLIDDYFLNYFNMGIRTTKDIIYSNPSYTFNINGWWTVDWLKKLFGFGGSYIDKYHEFVYGQLQTRILKMNSASDVNIFTNKFGDNNPVFTMEKSRTLQLIIEHSCNLLNNFLTYDFKSCALDKDLLMYRYFLLRPQLSKEAMEVLVEQSSNVYVIDSTIPHILPLLTDKLINVVSAYHIGEFLLFDPNTKNGLVGALHQSNGVVRDLGYRFFCYVADKVYRQHLSFEAVLKRPLAEHFAEIIEQYNTSFETTRAIRDTKGALPILEWFYCKFIESKGISFEDFLKTPLPKLEALINAQEISDSVEIGTRGLRNPYFSDLFLFRITYYQAYIAFPILCTISIMLVKFLFIFKLHLPPLHSWALTVYAKAPLGLSLILFVSMKIILLCTFLSVSANLQIFHSEIMVSILSTIALISIIYSPLKNLSERGFREFMILSSISHTGFMLLGFCVPNSDITNDIVLNYLLVYVVTNTLIWLVIINYPHKRPLTQISELTGFAKTNPFGSFIVSLGLLSLAGIPPLAGFYVKANILLALVTAHHTFIALVALLFTVISFFYYLRIIKIMYFSEPSVEDAEISLHTRFSGNIVSIIIITICISIIVAYSFAGIDILIKIVESWD